VKLIFNTYGNDKQKLCAKYWIDKTTADIVYGGAKAGGKSYLGCSLIFGDAFIYPETYYFIARKTLTDIRKFTIPSIHEVFEHWKLDDSYYKYNGQDNYFELHNRSKVFLLDAKYLPSDPLYTRFGSMQMTRGWIEEAGEFDETVKNNLAISIGRWKNDKYNLTPKLLQTCNPVKNYLYRDYYKKFKADELEDWKAFIQALPSDNKRLPEGYIDNLIKTLSKNELERLVYGNWEYDDDPATLVDYDAIVDMFSNTHIKEGIKYITADIARQGRDKTVIGVWNGFKLIKINVLDKNLITEAAELITKLKTNYCIPTSNIVVDEDGVGGGVKDILKCKGFVNNSKALKGENYSNLKSQCYFKLAKRINDREIYINGVDGKYKNQIVEECEQIKKDNIDKDGRQSVIPKDKIKELIGRSPDFSDMLMMREYFTLTKKVLNY